VNHTSARPGILPPPSDHHYLPRPDGARLALYTDGPDAAPVTVVLAHGWCATASIWHDHARHLAARGIRVIRYDQRGHGASLSGTSTASTRLLADDLAAMLRHTRRRTRVVVAGHSMGGMGVLQLAAHHPTVAARLSGVLLVATSSGQMDLTGAQHPRWNAWWAGLATPSQPCACGCPERHRLSATSCHPPATPDHRSTSRPTGTGRSPRTTSSQEPSAPCPASLYTSWRENTTASCPPSTRCAWSPNFRTPGFTWSPTAVTACPASSLPRSAPCSRGCADCTGPSHFVGACATPEARPPRGSAPEESGAPGGLRRIGRPPHGPNPLFPPVP